MLRQSILGLGLGLVTFSSVQAAEGARSAIFLHPDGMAANTWMAARLMQVGPDGRLAWDQLPKVAI